METFEDFKRRHKVPVMRPMILKNFYEAGDPKLYV